MHDAVQDLTRFALSVSYLMIKNASKMEFEMTQISSLSSCRVQLFELLHHLDYVATSSYITVARSLVN